MSEATKPSVRTEQRPRRRATGGAARWPESPPAAQAQLTPGPTNAGIRDRDKPRLQSPGAVYPTVRMLATLPAGEATGRAFWNEREQRLMDPANPAPDLRNDAVKPG